MSISVKDYEVVETWFPRFHHREQSLSGEGFNPKCFVPVDVCSCMGLRNWLFGGDNNSTDTESTLYRVTWTEMVEKEKTTALIQFVSGKQKRVVYTQMSGRDSTILEDETSGAEPVQVNWDNIEYVDTQSTETVEVPVGRSELVEKAGEKMREMYIVDSVVSETIDYEEV